MEQIKLNAAASGAAFGEPRPLGREVWKKIFASPLFLQTRTLFSQIFKRDVGLGDFYAMGITREEWRCIRGPSEGIPFSFCELLYKTEEGKRRCLELEKQASAQISTTLKTYICTCYTGLTEVGIPIIVYGKYCGCIGLYGGLLFHQPNETEWQQIAERVKDTSIDLEQLKKAYFDITPISKELLEIMLKVLNVIVEEIIRTVIETEEHKKRIAELEKALYEKYQFANIIGRSKPMQDVFRLLSRVIDSDSPVLIEGETGTGKELVAHTIHYNGPRKNGTFNPLNCGSLAETLLESELFGHIKGSFTGAIRDNKGLFEVTDKGTIFLDEVGEMSPALQVKLLRVLQEGTFIPVGGTETRKVDVRIISATNKNLKELVNQGKFREDLFYRLNVIMITLPSLRERKEDIPLLIKHFLKTLPSATEKKIEGVKPEAMKVIMDYHWPGNIRELQNVLEWAIALTNSNYLALDDLSEEIKQKETLPLSTGFDILKPFEEVKKEYIIRLLTETKGNITEAVRLSGLSSAGFYKLLKTYGIRLHTFK